MGRPIAANFTSEGLSVEPTCWTSVEQADAFVAFTAAMHVPKKVVYFAPLQPEKGRTNTPFNYPCKLCGVIVPPFLHVGSGNTSRTGQTGHEQCVDWVCDKDPSLTAGALDGDPKTNFCGFALNFVSERCALLSFTSRTLNPGVEGGDPGQLEPQIARPLKVFLAEKLKKIGWDLQGKDAPAPAKFQIPDLRIMCSIYGKEVGPDGGKVKWDDLTVAQQKECEAHLLWNWTRPESSWNRKKAEVLARAAKPTAFLPGALLGARNLKPRPVQGPGMIQPHHL